MRGGIVQRLTKQHHPHRHSHSRQNSSGSASGDSPTLRAGIHCSSIARRRSRSSSPHSPIASLSSSPPVPARHLREPVTVKEKEEVVSVWQKHNVNVQNAKSSHSDAVRNEENIIVASKHTATTVNDKDSDNDTNNINNHKDKDDGITPSPPRSTTTSTNSTTTGSSEKAEVNMSPIANGAHFNGNDSNRETDRRTTEDDNRPSDSQPIVQSQNQSVIEFVDSMATTMTQVSTEHIIRDTVDVAGHMVKQVAHRLPLAERALTAAKKVSDPVHTRLAPYVDAVDARLAPTVRKLSEGKKQIIQNGGSLRQRATQTYQRGIEFGQTMIDNYLPSALQSAPNGSVNAGAGSPTFHATNATELVQHTNNRVGEYSEVYVKRRIGVDPHALFMKAFSLALMFAQIGFLVLQMLLTPLQQIIKLVTGIDIFKSLHSDSPSSPEQGMGRGNGNGGGDGTAVTDDKEGRPSGNEGRSSSRAGTGKKNTKGGGKQV